MLIDLLVVLAWLLLCPFLGDVRLLAHRPFWCCNMEDKEHGINDRIPSWDGDPRKFKEFKRKVAWWLEGEELEKTAKFNLAARFVQRQRGIARVRGEEFDPAELRCRPVAGAVVEEGQAAPVDFTYGIRKVMEAFETMIGVSVQSRKGELREEYYEKLMRMPSERVIEFATRFRTKISEMKKEGIEVDPEDAGFQFKRKLGLSAVRL